MTRIHAVKKKNCTELFDECTHACLGQVLNADVVHREERCSGAVLWTHVGDGCSVSDGELGNTWTEKLHELPHYTHLTQVLTKQVGIMIIIIMNRIGIGIGMSPVNSVFQLFLSHGTYCTLEKKLQGVQLN